MLYRTCQQQELLSSFDNLRPEVLSLSPDINGKTDVSPTLTELTIYFSEPMAKEYSINLGEGGKAHFPITGVTGFSDDCKPLKVKLALQPGKSYNFVIADQSFRSKANYPLKPCAMHFEVK